MDDAVRAGPVECLRAVVSSYRRTIVEVWKGMGVVRERLSDGLRRQAMMIDNKAVR